jgi:dihydrofolate reductase
MSDITLVVAAAENGVIGDKGAIPWRISDDLKRFKALTMGYPIVMGRKTWDTLPKKPLPGRTNIVVTRQADWTAEGAVTAHSVEEAIAKAGDADEVFVIGGAEIYAAAMPLANCIELTEVHAEFDGDAVLPPLEGEWDETGREGHQTEDGLYYSFVTLERVTPGESSAPVSTPFPAPSPPSSPGPGRPALRARPGR